MVSEICITEIRRNTGTPVILDVRTPAEFARGHIPGAHNLPLFSNEERAIVGTIHKQEGPAQAMRRGLDLVGPRLAHLAEQGGGLLNGSPGIIHCWRGGKRSASVAWLLDFCGNDVAVLKRGYRAFRRHAQQAFASDQWDLVVLGGRTGSGKTTLLRTLRSLGEQVIDLEALANHKGSAFGGIGEPEQPMTEHFENLLYDALSACDPGRRIWVENESKSIGRVYIPDALWVRMKAAPLIHLEVPDEQRIARLVKMYAGHAEVADLRHAFVRIAKRLGGQHVKAALSALDNGDFTRAAAIALRYYDKTYDYNLRHNRSPSIHVLALKDHQDLHGACREIITFADTRLAKHHATHSVSTHQI